MPDQDKIKDCVEQIKNSAEEILKILENKDTNFKISKPFLGNYRITQKFGENPSFYGQWGYAGHFGEDYATPIGTEILAVDQGVVSRAGFSSGNGYFVEIKHSWGYSLYCHMKAIPPVKVGNLVKRGDCIGLSGNTGIVIPKPTKENPNAGAHLHFSMKVFGVKNAAYLDFVDPADYFA